MFEDCSDVEGASLGQGIGLLSLCLADTCGSCQVVLVRQRVCFCFRLISSLALPTAQDGPLCGSNRNFQEKSVKDWEKSFSLRREEKRREEKRREEKRREREMYIK
jgi:hypothetical protein